MIDGNVAYGHGGGFWNRTGTVTIDGGTGTIEIRDNVAGADSPGGAGSVGGARHGGGFYGSDGGTTNLTNVDFVGNTVTSDVSDNLTGVGAGFYAVSASKVNLTNVDISSHSAESGGAFFLDSAGTALVGTNVTLDDNTARTRGGAFRVANTFASVQLTDSSISGNTVENEHGGGFYNNGSVVLINTDVTDNRALDVNASAVGLNGGNGTQNARRDSHGGGFYNTGGSVTVTGGRIGDNSTYGYGGGFNNSGRSGYVNGNSD